MEQRARLILLIKGRVQGVGFRYAALDTATQLGLTGWVRNTREGHVELTAEGKREHLQRLATWSHAGPRGALVIDVEQRWLPHTGEFDSFRIKY